MCSTAGFVALVVAVIHAITAVAVGDTSPVGAGERVGAALQRGGLIGGVVHTRLLVGGQLHAVRTATHPLGVWGWETEMTAVPIRVGWSVAEIAT